MERPTKRDEVIQDIGIAFAKQHNGGGIYSPTGFMGIFRLETLSEKQTLGMALAEWHAVFASTTVFNVWGVFGLKPELVKSVLDVFQQGIAEAVRDTCQDEFYSIIEVRELEYVRLIGGAVESESSADCIKPFGLMVRRIMGTYDEEVEATEVHAPTDVLTTAVLQGLVVSDIKRGTEFLRSEGVQYFLK